MMYEAVSEWLRWGWPLVIDHLWQATLFFLFVLVISRIMGQGPARARYALWLVASLKFALPSTLFIFIARQTGFSIAALQSLAINSTKQAAAVTIIRPVSTLEQSNIIASVQRLDNFYLALTIVWIIGLTFFIGLWWKRRAQFARAIRAGKHVTTGREADALHRAQKRLGITRPIRLILSPELTEPGVCGMRNPVMILPAGISRHLQDEELEAVAMHEVAHVRRRDNVVGNVQMLLCCLFWFHPFVWLIDRRLLVERERACDEEVIKIRGETRSYVSGILKLCCFYHGWRVGGVSGMAGANLRQRIAEITTNSVDKKLRISHQLTLGLTGLLMVIFSVAGAESRRTGFRNYSQAVAGPNGELTSKQSDQDRSNVDASEAQRVAAQRESTSRKKDVVAFDQQRGEATPKSSPNPAAPSDLRPERPGAAPALIQGREVAQPDIEEIKRKAAQEHPEDADDAEIVVVVNKNQQVTTTRTDSKVVQPRKAGPPQ